VNDTHRRLDDDQTEYGNHEISEHRGSPRTHHLRLGQDFM
jgi:hypothetical protein